MLELTYYSAQYMATRNSFAYKDALKSIAPWPDVRFDGDAKCWLVDWRCFDALVERLGSELCGTPDFWLRFPAAMPSTPRRKTKQQIMAEKRVQQAAAGRWGAAIVEMGKR